MPQFPSLENEGTLEIFGTISDMFVTTYLSNSTSIKQDTVLSGQMYKDKTKQKLLSSRTLWAASLLSLSLSLGFGSTMI